MELLAGLLVVVLAVFALMWAWEKTDEVAAYGRALDEVAALRGELHALVVEREQIERELAAVHRHRKKLQDELTASGSPDL